jgi:dTDP-glucose 4,6-dehydratase
MLTDAEAEPILARTRPIWSSLAGSRIFITGGSGFFGRWMLTLLNRANEKCLCNISAVVLTRNQDRTIKRLSNLNQDSRIQLRVGDLESLFTPDGSFDFVFHLAGEPSGPKYIAEPDGMGRKMVDGCRSMLTFAKNCGSPTILFVSSGAVYGPHPERMKINEDDGPWPEPSISRRLYAEAKRAGEQMCQECDLPLKIARPFAFIGPGMPLDSTFAVCQFIADGLAGRKVHVRDGCVARSYLYASDLAEWLWTIVHQGIDRRPYNVGSVCTLQLRELGELIAEQFKVPLQVDSVESNECYVPSTNRALTDLGLTQTVTISDAVERTVRWYVESHR